jgi:general secretion pathway protein A
MYNQFFGLRKSPFSLTADPEFLYLTAQHREALAGLTYGVLGRKGFVVLTGDAGTGKTTLVAKVLEQFSSTRIRSSVLVNPTLTPAEFLEAILLNFGHADVPASKAQRLMQLQALLLKSREEGKISALIVDEAHKLSPEVLEEIRLLGNFELANEKLLQIALLGQSELDELLNREHLRQFKQRVALRLSIAPLSAADVAQYIRYRWMKAGGIEPPFSVEAVRCIARVSRGIPRVINVICDNAMMHAFGESSVSVELRHVSAVCVDLCLREPAGQQDAPTQLAPLITSAPPANDYPLKTLERYSTTHAKSSRLARFAGKLGFAHRIETA